MIASGHLKEWTLAEVLSSPEQFFSFLKIKNKKGDVVPFLMNGEQQALLEAYNNRGDKSLLVLKPRQIGSSTFFAALLFWRWYTAVTPITIYSVSHTYDSAQNFNSMYKCFWDNLPEFLKVRELSKMNTQTITLADTGATLEIRTAGSKGGMRSFSCNILHLSEFAFYPDAEEFMATAVPALNDGLLIIESTPNFWGDALHKKVIESRAEGSPYNFLFFPWFKHREYVIPRVSVIPTEEEGLLKEKYGLSGIQLAWRRRKILDMGISKFRRDFPAEIEEAYSLTGDSWCSEAEISSAEVIWSTEGDAQIISEPIRGLKYAIGADVAGGVGKDYSVFYVLDVRSKDIVYKFCSNSIKPTDLAHKLQEVSVRYNGAKILSERNSIGEVIYSEFKNLGVWNYWKDDAGNPWLTTAKNKPIILNNLRKALSSGALSHLDSVLIDQLRSIRVDNKGDPDFNSRDNSNGHFDSIIAIALALTCAESIPIFDMKSTFQAALDKELAKERRASRLGTFNSH